MKNIDFTDFFNVFLSGATLMGRLFFFAVAFLSGACYTIGVHAKTERNILSQGGYEDEEKILDRYPYRRAAAESSAGDDAGGIGGGRYVIDGG